MFVSDRKFVTPPFLMAQANMSLRHDSFPEVPGALKVLRILMNTLMQGIQKQFLPPISEGITNASLQIYVISHLLVLCSAA